MRKSILIISFILTTALAWAQPNVAGNESVIQGAQAFAISTSTKVFKVVHIGDSHIQADFFSGKIRELLQAHFGNAGVGLVFPYKQINTNGPKSYSSLSSQPLTSNKIVKCKSMCNVGIAAYNAILPTGADITFNLKKDTSTQFVSLLYTAQNTNALKVNNDNNADNYTIQTTANYTIASYKNEVGADFTINANGFTVLNGVIVNNGKPGVLYHTIGANGATFANYNNSTLFFDQLSALEPDLIIISLGTNESVSEITNDSFVYNMHQFYLNTRQAANQAKIIFTTPADNAVKHTATVRKKVKGKWRTKRITTYQTNKKLIEQKDIMLAYCNANKIMVWDLFTAMGGEGSMKEWVKTGYAARDHIHFSKGGYELQGQLFYDALMQLLINP
jgi:lysophospholipase L1-like esterase